MRAVIDEEAPSDGTATEEEKQERSIQSLQTERAGYVARGEKKRVAEVDSELEKLGVTRDAKKPAQRAERRG